MNKKKLTTVGDVDWSSSCISRVGIIPYTIKNNEVWMSFGVSNLTSKLITIGGGVEKTDFNIFAALVRELKEEIGIAIDENIIAGSLVLVHNDQLLLFWNVDESKFRCDSHCDKNELENIIWVTQSQFSKMSKRGYGTCEYLSISSTILHFEKDIGTIDLINFVPDKNELPMNYDKEKKKILDTQKIGDYKTFINDFVGKTWYIVYIYKFKDKFFMKNEKNNYYVFHNNEINSVLYFLYKSQTLSVYFPNSEEYRYLENNYKRPRFLDSLILKYIPSLQNFFKNVILEAKDVQTKYYNADKNDINILLEAMYVVDVMSELETQIYDIHREKGNIKKNFNYNTIGSINNLFLTSEKKYLDIYHIMNVVGIKAVEQLVANKLPYYYNSLTKLVSML